MEWSKVEKLPKYNPWCFGLMRHLEGLSRSEFARKAKMSTAALKAIEFGEIEPTEEQVDALVSAQSHLLKSFLGDWPETELDISGPLAKNVPINYYKYKVFRDLNKPPLRVV